MMSSPPEEGIYNYCRNYDQWLKQFKAKLVKREIRNMSLREDKINDVVNEKIFPNRAEYKITKIAAMIPKIKVYFSKWCGPKITDEYKAQYDDPQKNIKPENRWDIIPKNRVSKFERNVTNWADQNKHKWCGEFLAMVVDALKADIQNEQIKLMNNSQQYKFYVIKKLKVELLSTKIQFDQAPPYALIPNKTLQSNKQLQKSLEIEQFVNDYNSMIYFLNANISEEAKIENFEKYAPLIAEYTFIKNELENKKKFKRQRNEKSTIFVTMLLKCCQRQSDEAQAKLNKQTTNASDTYNNRISPATNTSNTYDNINNNNNVSSSFSLPPIPSFTIPPPLPLATPTPYHNSCYSNDNINNTNNIDYKLAYEQKAYELKQLQSQIARLIGATNITNIQSNIPIINNQNNQTCNSQNSMLFQTNSNSNGSFLCQNHINTNINMNQMATNNVNYQPINHFGDTNMGSHSNMSMNPPMEMTETVDMVPPPHQYEPNNGYANQHLTSYSSENVRAHPYAYHMHNNQTDLLIENNREMETFTGLDSLF